MYFSSINFQLKIVHDLERSGFGAGFESLVDLKSIADQPATQFCSCAKQVAPHGDFSWAKFNIAFVVIIARWWDGRIGLKSYSVATKTVMPAKIVLLNV